MDAVHVINRLVEDRAVAVRPVGTDGGVVSPVAVGEGDAVGDADGDEVGEGDGELEGDGDADGDGDGEVPGVTSPVMVQDSVQVCASAPGTILQSCVDGTPATTALVTGAAYAKPTPPTTMPAKRHARPTAERCARCMKVMPLTIAQLSAPWRTVLQQKVHILAQPRPKLPLLGPFELLDGDQSRRHAVFLGHGGTR